MKDKHRTSVVFRELYEAMRPKGDTRCDMPGLVACETGKSRQTVRQYACDPDSRQHRVPPVEVLDKMRHRVMHEDVHRPSTLRSLTRADGYKVSRVTLADYEAALDLADSLLCAVVPQGDSVVPVLSDDARLRHQWRQVFFGGVVDRADLAILAGVDVYDVAWVGREHSTRGIQPTAEMVAQAIALEALSGIERKAA